MYLAGPQKCLSFEPEHLIARKRMSHFFNQHLDSCPNLFVDRETDNLYEADPVTKRMLWRSQLTAARFQTSEQGKKVFFGQPPQLLVIEHLAFHMELDALRNVFADALESFQFNSNLGNEAPCQHPIDMHTRLVDQCYTEWEDLMEF